jgi:hypothetical protein
LICGGFTNATVVVAEVEFPATSAAWTWIEFVPAASVRRQLNDDPVKVAGLPPHVIVANPEMESLTVPVIVILETPTVVPGAGETIVTTGGDLSRLTVLCVLAVLPAMSAAVPVMIWLPPSVLIDTGAGHSATFESESEHE